MKPLSIDVGSTYFKVSAEGAISHYFRSFDKRILDDLSGKCGDILEKYSKEETYICSSANGGLSTLIIGLTQTLSLKYAVNIAFNSGINLIDTVLLSKIGEAVAPLETVDVVILVGGIDSVGGIFDERLIGYLRSVHYKNIVFVGSAKEVPFLRNTIDNLLVLENIIDNHLQPNEEALKNYLTNLYQTDIIGKEDIKELYALSANQIYPTPYVVNRAMSYLKERFTTVDPFILIDIGGATTDIHFSKDLMVGAPLSENLYDRVVFKKLGVYKSRESLVFSAKQNEYVYELLGFLGVTENILEERSETALRVLMQLAVFLVLYKVSSHHGAYIELQLEKVESILFTGGITKVLTAEQVSDIVHFLYKKILNFHHIPAILLDTDYEIWTLGLGR